MESPAQPNDTDDVNPPGILARLWRWLQYHGYDGDGTPGSLLAWSSETTRNGDDIA